MLVRPKNSLQRATKLHHCKQSHQNLTLFPMKAWTFLKLKFEKAVIRVNPRKISSPEV